MFTELFVYLQSYDTCVNANILTKLMIFIELKEDLFNIIS